MNSLNYYKSLFTHIYVLKSIVDHTIVVQAISRLPDIPVIIIENKEEIPHEHQNQHTLFITRSEGQIVDRCPGSKGHICCNYITINLYVGCTIGCTYCIMKSYLNFSPITVNLNIEGSIRLIKELARKNLGVPIRIGTGEVGDSLLFDPLFRISEIFLSAFADEPNIVFELKTKTDYVDHLITIPEKGKAVIGFSLNPENIAADEEPFAATINERLAAARRAYESGFRISFHFDPVIFHPGWEKAYTNLVSRLHIIPESAVAWISIGTFRYPPKLREKIESRWFLYDEFVVCRDKKFRYIQNVRAQMNKLMIDAIRDCFPQAPVYMCMESPYMWRKIFGKIPIKIENLCDIFKQVKL